MPKIKGMEPKKFSKVIVGVIFLLIMLLSFRIEVFQISGSNKAFTLHNLVAPVSLGFVPSYVAIPMLIITKTYESFSIISLLFTLPSIMAMLAFKYNNTFFKFVIPVLGILFFLLHPNIGYGKSIYFLLWLIPVIASLKEHLLTKSIVSTFNAHIVGSIIFLYFVDPINAAFWNTLIPVVIIERLVFSLGIALSYLTFKQLTIVIENFSERVINNYKQLVRI